MAKIVFKNVEKLKWYLEKTVAILRRHHWSPQNDVWGATAIIPYWWRVTSLWLFEANFRRGTTNQKHYLDQGSHYGDTSSVWNFCWVVPQTPFPRETIGCVAREMSGCFLYSPINFRMFCKTCIKTILICSLTSKIYIYLLIFACWFRSVVVITSALHAEGRQFNSGRSHLILFLSYCYFF